MSQCWGITGSLKTKLKRCELQAGDNRFCHHHRWQPLRWFLTALFIVAAVIGIIWGVCAFIKSCNFKPIVISPSKIQLPATTEPLDGSWSVPADITVQNRSEKDLYSVWVCFHLSDANLTPADLDFVDRIDKSYPQFKQPYNLTRNLIEPATGRVTLLLKNVRIPKLDFNRVALYVVTATDDGKKKAYIGMPRLPSGDPLYLRIRINGGHRKQEESLPIRIASFSHKQSTWLHEKEEDVLLDFVLPDARSFREPIQIGFLEMPVGRPPQ